MPEEKLHVAAVFSVAWAVLGVSDSQVSVTRKLVEEKKEKKEKKSSREKEAAARRELHGVHLTVSPGCYWYRGAVEIQLERFLRGLGHTEELV